MVELASLVARRSASSVLANRVLLRNGLVCVLWDLDTVYTPSAGILLTVSL